MTIDIRLPAVNTQGSAEAQIGQMRSYMYQLVEQLNWALSTLESGIADGKSESIEVTQSAAMSEKDAQDTFNSIKSMIIKSADIVNAYYEEINKVLSGEYVAQSDFGVFSEQTNSQISANASAITQFYTDIQQITSTIEDIDDALIAVSAHIKTGILDYAEDGTPIYGVEVGQKTEKDGEEVFNKFARFTSDRLSFYDQNGNEVSYISDYKLHITNAVIKGNLQLGGYILDTANGIAFKWVGRS